MKVQFDSNIQTDKNRQCITRYIKNWADSAKFEVFNSHLTLRGLTVNCSEMPNFSYTATVCNTCGFHFI
ncbi:MAG: hypothetical protein BWZ11_00308 [Bacteroidetes bacterium ADurb.BinA395]|jgi:hypothetical protein|nr:MAG: hypothetical protein BWZ11_00308 [Bacteroidetes bacterium ADurb.BinA395]